DYTLAAVSALARKSGLSDDDIAAAQRAQAKDPRTVAALRFSEILLETRGHVSSSNLDTLTEAGFTDGEVAEIVACVVLNIYRNYFNLVAGPEIDFPVVKRSVAMGGGLLRALPATLTPLPLISVAFLVISCDARHG